jgi:hypothetical protein
MSRGSFIEEDIFSSEIFRCLFRKDVFYFLNILENITIYILKNFRS